MTTGVGEAFLLKIKAEKITELFSTIAGMRISSLLIKREVVPCGERSGAWRELLSDQGDLSVTIHAKGIFLGSAGEGRVRGAALGGEIAEYQIFFEKGLRLQGQFFVHRLDYSGDFNGERNYSITLESSGEVKVL